MSALLVVDGLEVHFGGRRGAETVSPVDGVSLEVERGATLGLVGESGWGRASRRPGSRCCG